MPSNRSLPLTYTVLSKNHKTTKSKFRFNIIHLHPIKIYFTISLDLSNLLDLNNHFYLHVPTCPTIEYILSEKPLSTYIPTCAYMYLHVNQKTRTAYCAFFMSF